MRGWTNARRWAGGRRRTGGRVHGGIGRVLDSIGWAFGLVLLAASACSPPDAGRPDALARAFVEVTDAEDARPAGGPRLQTLLDATESPDPQVRRFGVRALGRLEDPAHADAIRALLDDPHPRVRAQAADALAQSFHGVDGSPALRPLLARAGMETQPGAVAGVAQALGRIQVPEADAREVGRMLTRLSRQDAPGTTTRLVGVALGMESLARWTRGAAVGPVLLARLQELAGGAWPGPLVSPTAEAPVRVRTLAFLALGRLGGRSDLVVAPETLDYGLDDPAPAVRRAATLLLGAPPVVRLPDLSERTRRLVVRADDPDARVRIAALRALLAGPRDADLCRLLMDRGDSDSDSAVRIVALDALSQPCPDRTTQENLLASIALTLDPADELEWHDPAHALFSLAALDADAARGILPRFVDHPSPFARAWAARIAGRLGDVETLRSFRRDSSANVLTAALPGLVTAQGRAADDVLLSVLAERNDPQLLLTAAQLLEATSRPEPAAHAAVAALSRISEERLQTRRDARLALLDLVQAVGDSSRIRDVEPYIRDYDPAVADRAAEILLGWSGQRWIAAPRGSPRLDFPTADDLRAMETATLELEMERGGVVSIRLLPFTAPTNAYRLYTLAGSGRLDGLTLHRVVPNFVVQGGSPGANEYAGHGAFTRDEVGLVSQWRGTVGVSTRGRDTGDGQIYVNLVDNVRLNHDYTILGHVVGGMEVVDAIREGDVIRGVRIVED